MRTHANVLALILGVLVSLTVVADAGHSETERITEDSPYTLRPGEIKIGLASIEYGLWGHPLLRMIDVGTNPWLWLTNTVGLRSYNLRGKYEFYSDDRLSLSIRSSFYQLGRGGTRLRLIPIEVYSAVRISPDWTVGAGYKHARLSVRGAAELTDDIDAVGDVGFSTAQLRAMVEWRLSGLTAFVVRGALQRYQQLRAEAGVESDNADGGAGVFVDKNLLPAELAFNVAAAVAWSWDSLNIELGLQYGNPTVPGINAIVPERIVLPVVDMYWRF